MTNATCCCGSLAIEVNGNPLRYGLCHCENCKKRTGSVFGVSTYFHTKQVLRTIGVSNTYAFNCKQSEGSQKRYFCAKCGTTLYWVFSDSPEEVGIAGGCFDSGYLGKPQYSISEEEKVSWLKLHGLVSKKD